MDNQKLISVADFSPEELRKWQLKLLEILVYFRDFCQENNLRFFLAAGTSLGAVRHKGFIPWDDDVDVTMPREDYDKLIKIWNKKADTSRFVCEVTRKDYCAKFPMAVIRSVNTTCIYDHSVDDDICQGMKIDVEFLDGLPNSSFGQKINENCAFVFALMRGQRVPARPAKKYKIIAKVLLTLFPTKSIRYAISNLCEKRLKKFKFSESEYVRYLFSSKKKREWYDDVKYLEFEGYQMPVPIGVEKVLTAGYKDYMQFPPEEKRKPATKNLFFYDLDHSYLDYKGKKYCVKQK